MDEEIICRICRSGNGSLSRPCKCLGSMMYIHQSCLEQWLRYSRNDKCEICGHKFQFTKLYVDSVSRAATVPLVIKYISRKIAAKGYLVFVALCWSALAPAVCAAIWNLFFHFWDSCSILARWFSLVSIIFSKLMSLPLGEVFQVYIPHLAERGALRLMYGDRSWVRGQLFLGYGIILGTAILVLGLLVLREVIITNTPVDPSGNPRLPTLDEIAREKSQGDSEAEEPGDRSIPLHLLVQPDSAKNEEEDIIQPEVPSNFDWDRPVRYASPGTESTIVYMFHSSFRADNFNMEFDKIHSKECLFECLEFLERFSSKDSFVAERASAVFANQQRESTLLRPLELELDKEILIQVWMNMADPVEPHQLRMQQPPPVPDDDFDEALGVNVQNLYDVLGIDSPLSTLVQNLALLLLMVFVAIFFTISLPMQFGWVCYKLAQLIGFGVVLAKHASFDVAADSTAKAVLRAFNFGSEIKVWGNDTAQTSINASVVDFLDESTLNLSLMNSLILGWGCLIIFAAVVVPQTGLSRNPYVYTVLKLCRRWTRGMLKFPKFVTFFAIELFIIPMGCCMAYLMVSLPILTGLDVKAAWSYLLFSSPDFSRTGQMSPMVSLFMRAALWMVGAHFMFHFTSLVAFLRQCLRPGLLWFIRDPNDPNFDPMSEMMDKPILSQLRRLGFGTLMYVAVGVFTLVLFIASGYLVSLASFALLYLFSGPKADIIKSVMRIWPLQVRYHATLPALLYFPVDISVGVFLYRLLSKTFLQLPFVRSFFLQCLVRGADYFELGPFLFKSEENRPDKITQPKAYRVPNTDDLKLPVPIQEYIMIPMRADDHVFGRAFQSTREVEKLWTKVAVPKSYFFRSFLWMFFVCLGTVGGIGGSVFLLLPLITGRLLSLLLFQPYVSNLMIGAANITVTNSTVLNATSLYSKRVVLDIFPPVRPDLPLHDVQSFLVGAIVLYCAYFMATSSLMQQWKLFFSFKFCASAVIVGLVTPFLAGSAVCWSFVAPIARSFLSNGDQKAFFFLIPSLSLNGSLVSDLFSNLSLALNNLFWGVMLLLFVYLFSKPPNPLFPKLAESGLSKILVDVPWQNMSLWQVSKPAIYFFLYLLLPKLLYRGLLEQGVAMAVHSEPDKVLQSVYPCLLLTTIVFNLVKFIGAATRKSLMATIDDALLVGQVLNDFPANR